MKMTTARWQVVSLSSKLTAILLGLLANIVVLRILTPEEWGIISLALSVVGSVSVLHHLGIQSGLNREIAREDDNKVAATIIFSAIGMRLPVSIVIAFAIYAAAPYIAHTVYSQPELVLPLRLLGFFVIIDGFQDILSSAVGALRLFKRLFIFQVVLSCINVVALVAGVMYAGFIGFIYAKYVYAGASMLIFGIVLLRFLSGPTTSIRWTMVTSYIKGIISIGAAVFVQKIAFLYWQKIPTVVMGKIVAIGDIGLYGFVDYFTQRLTIFSDAATDVSVPVFMRSFTHDYPVFVREFVQNFWRVAGVTIVFLVLGTLFFEEFLIIAGLTKYQNTQLMFMVMGFGMLFVSLVNTVGVVFVAGNNRKPMIIAYMGMFAVTLALVVPLTQQFGVLGGAVAFTAGSLFGIVYYFLALWQVYKIQLLNQQYSVIAAPLVLLVFFSSGLFTRLSVTVIFTLAWLLIVYRSNSELFHKIFHKARIFLKRT